jgi:phytoene dehydrogenase-like protein
MQGDAQMLSHAEFDNRHTPLPPLTQMMHVWTLIHCTQTNPRLKALLSYVSLGCCGVPPSDIQYSLVTGLHCHFAGGGNYPVEGGKAVAEAMVRQIERQGGKVRCSFHR